MQETDGCRPEEQHENTRNRFPESSVGSYTFDIDTCISSNLLDQRRTPSPLPGTRTGDEIPELSQQQYLQDPQLRILFSLVR
jgi:hypothetical protein